MSRMCDICAKGPKSIVPRKLLRGNWNPTGKKRKFPNLQTYRHEGGKIKLCTTCLKTIKRDQKKQQA